MPEFKVLDLFSGIRSADSASDSSESDFVLSPSAKSSPSADRSSPSTGPGSIALKTYRRENIARVKHESLQRGSLARTSVTQATAPDLQGLAQAYGERLYVPFAWWDRTTACWRTWQRCLIEGWARFSETWPRSGMTRSGIAYQLPALVSPSLGTDSGLLPTITANEGKGSARSRYRGSTQYRGAKMSEGLRTGEADPIYTDPSFAEAAMGFPRGWTQLETPLLPSSQKSSGAKS